MIRLPTPLATGTLSLEETISFRRSCRSFSTASSSLSEVGQVLWAAQGLTDPHREFRSCPSAGALYPLETYVVVNRLTDLAPGVYRYIVPHHGIEQVKAGHCGEQLAMAALNQRSIALASFCVILTSEHSRICSKYGQRGRRYAIIEVGCATQSLCLQAIQFDLKSLVIGAFDDVEVQKAAGIPTQHEPICIVCIGK
ncbi:hypothetical protein RCL1_009091 [Eukaryota sp. TZLM3-RCL]